MRSSQLSLKYNIIWENCLKKFEMFEENENKTTFLSLSKIIGHREINGKKVAY